MPDASHPYPAAPLDWSDAFNALPLETPPGDAWARLALQLHARPASRRVPAWLGVAAAAAVVAVLAWPRTAVEPAPVRLPPGSPATRVADVPDVATPPTATQVPAPRRTVAVPPRQVRPGLDTGAATASRRRAVEPTVAPTIEPAVEPDVDRIRDLQAESARLEALLAYARDERVGSASAVLLADAFDAQVAGIDAALVAPDLEASRREALWQARVEALQQAAGFVSTQRLLATQGQSEALLVSVD